MFNDIKSDIAVTLIDIILDNLKNKNHQIVAWLPSYMHFFHSRGIIKNRPVLQETEADKSLCGT